MERLQSRWAFPVIVVVAFSVRVGWALFSPALPPPTSDFATYNHWAHQIAAGFGYRTAFRVPGYPFFLAGLYLVFGDYLIVPKTANALLGTLTCLLTYVVAWIVFERRVALVAAAITGLLPSHILYTAILATEPLFTCLMMGSAALYLFALKSERARWSLLACSGFLLGLSVLVRPVSLLLPVAWGFSLLWQRIPLGKVLLTTAVVVMAMMIVVSPWLVRNFKYTGRVTLATSGGINLLISFNEHADGHYVREVRVAFREEVEEKGLGESESDALAYQRAVEFVRAHPLRALTLIPAKWYHLFRDDCSGVTWNFRETSRPLPQVFWYILVFVSQGYYMALMGMAVVGLFHLRKPYVTNRWYIFLLGIVVYWLAFHAVFFGDDRFHFPLLPILSVFSGFGLLRVARRWSRGPRYLPTKHKSEGAR